MKENDCIRMRNDLFTKMIIPTEVARDWFLPMWQVRREIAAYVGVTKKMSERTAYSWVEVRRQDFLKELCNSLLDKGIHRSDLWFYTGLSVKSIPAAVGERRSRELTEARKRARKEEAKAKARAYRMAQKAAERRGEGDIFTLEILEKVAEIQQEGRLLGKKPREVKKDLARYLLTEGLKPTQIMKFLGISRPTLGKWRREF